MQENQNENLGKAAALWHKVATAHIFNVLRILKAKNLGDTYYEEYLKHYAREGEAFFDQYHVALLRVIEHQPKRILEIGVRTGLSICNLLSAYIDHSIIEKVILIDVWNDGFASPEIVKMNLRALNISLGGRLEFIKGDSKIEVQKLIDKREKFSHILVDGDHSKLAAAQDLLNAVELCEVGGIIIFDDISKWGCDLKDVWDAFKSKQEGQFMFQENYDGKGVGWAVRLC